MSKPEHVARQRFTARIKEWWPEADAEFVEGAVDELMTDIGYTIKVPSIRRTDPVAYALTHREYMRGYQQRRRAKLKGVG